MCAMSLARPCGERTLEALAGAAPRRVLARLELPSRPRVIASGDLGGDGKPEVAVITVGDDLLLVRGPNDVTKLHLGDEQATCALFGADKKSIYVGFQGSRRVVRYEIDATGG